MKYFKCQLLKMLSTFNVSAEQINLNFNNSTRILSEASKHYTEDTIELDDGLTTFEAIRWFFYDVCEGVRGREELYFTLKPHQIRVRYFVNKIREISENI